LTRKLSEGTEDVQKKADETKARVDAARARSDAYKESVSKAREWAHTFSSSISDALTGSESLADAWSRAFRSIIARAFEATLDKQLEGAFTKLATLGSGERSAPATSSRGDTVNITINGGQTQSSELQAVVETLRAVVESRPTYIQMGCGINYEASRGRI